MVASQPSNGPSAQAEAAQDRDTPVRSIPVVSFVAPSGTGKTTLMAEVIGHLASQRVRVGAIKHDAHRIELDTEGKDSWRLRQAGAAETLLVGENQHAWMSAVNSGPNLQELIPLMEQRVDIILVEGFRSAGLPSIIVQRPDAADETWEPPHEGEILATVHPSEVDRVIEILATTFGVGR